MTKTADLCGDAVSNALAAIGTDKQFPANIFEGEWADYVFFGSDKLFMGNDFIPAKNLLLAGEPATVVAMINLGGDTLPRTPDPRPLFLTAATTDREYFSELDDRGTPPFTWVMSQDDYILASDEGTWAIYCERRNDLGVFAARSGFALSVRLRIREMLEGAPIEEAINSPARLSFPFSKLVPEWRSGLLRAYGERR